MKGNYSPIISDRFIASQRIPKSGMSNPESGITGITRGMPGRKIPGRGDINNNQLIGDYKVASEQIDEDGDLVRVCPVTGCLANLCTCGLFNNCCDLIGKCVIRSDTDELRRNKTIQQIQWTDCIYGIGIETYQSKGFIAISRCPSDFDLNSDVRLYCESPSSNLATTIPVYIDDWLPFKNMYCAMCHGFNDTRYKPASLVLQCTNTTRIDDVITSVHNASLSDDTAKVRLPEDCRLSYAHHRQVRMVLQPCMRSNLPVTSHCNESADQDLRSKCRRVFNPISAVVGGRVKTYRNYYCMKCELSDSVLNESTLVCTYDLTGQKTFGLNILLDFSLANGVEFRTAGMPVITWAPKDFLCSETNEIFDQETRRCRGYGCLRGYRRLDTVEDNAVCRLVENEWPRISVRVYFSFFITFNETQRFVMKNFGYELMYFKVKVCGDVHKSKITEIGSLSSLSNESSLYRRDFTLTNHEEFLGDVTMESILSKYEAMITCQFGNDGSLVTISGYELSTTSLTKNTRCDVIDTEADVDNNMTQTGSNSFLAQSNPSFKYYRISRITSDDGKTRIVKSSKCSTKIIDCVRVYSDTGAMVCRRQNNSKFKITVSSLFSDRDFLITFTCSCLSVVSLVITVVIYLNIPDLRTLPGKLIVNLCTTLAVAQTLHISSLVGVDNRLLCVSMAAVKHYIWMVVFASMAAVSIHMFLTFSTIRKPVDSTKTLLYYLLSVWLSPFLIVGPCIVLHNTDTTQYSGAVYGSPVTCWFSSSFSLLMAFVLPIGIIDLVSIILFVATVCRIHRSFTAMSTSSSNAKQKRTTTFIFYRMALVTGVTWVVGFVASFVNNDYLWYFFNLLNSSQGFLVFLAFIANKRVFDMCRAKFNFSRAAKN
ncbi:uncharacterized protein LOC141910474 [Tubulanus polymorphus]|uniref:uncharacterized protein LOC141910474 n=1 Tax=Tubulanus polymorphus TaxID=672921 RepID=UPI003DA3853A